MFNTRKTILRCIGAVWGTEIHFSLLTDFFLIKKCSFSDEESGGQKMLLSV